MAKTKVKNKKKVTKKLDILQIEDNYNQSVSIYLKTLKNKLKSLEKWEFEKKLYKTKIEALKNKNKMLKTKIELAQRDNQKTHGCCPIFNSCTRAVQVFPSSLIDDNLSESGDSMRDSLLESRDDEDDDNDHDNDHDDNDEDDDDDDDDDDDGKKKKLKCLSLVKAGALATGLLV